MKSKKAVGLQLTTLFFVVLALVGLFAIGNWIMGGGLQRGTGLTVQPEIPALAAQPALEGLTFTEDVTVTFSSYDAYSIGTDAGVGHRILELDGDINVEVADDGTKEKSPGAAYKVLIGNVTTTFTAGTTYYPVYVTGLLPDKGTKTISAGQSKSGGASQLTYTYFNDAETANTAQAIGASDTVTMEWKIKANDNVCIGNPDVNGDNAMSYTYNTTTYQKVVQLDVNNNEQTAIPTPTAVTVRTGHAIKAYTFPVVCDNDNVRRSVLIKSQSTQPSSSKHNINMTVSDITIDYHADTLEIIGGIGANGIPNGAYEDESNNDLGVTDFALAGLKVS